MKRPQYLTANSILFALLLATVLAISTAVLRAQTSQETYDQQAEQTEAQSESQNLRGRLKELQAQRLEGSWEVIVTPVVPPWVPQPPSFHVYTTFSHGGGYTGSDRTRPFSKQHGVWEHLGGNSFAGTFKEDLFDAMGNFAGILTVRTRTTLTGRDTYVGVANGEFRDAAGNITRSACTTFRGTRIKVEPLPDQCQGITPPR